MMLALVMSAEIRIQWNATHNFGYRGRPLYVISRSISIIPSIPADDKCHVCMTQSCQLICLLDQIWFPPGELLRFCFRCVWHVVRVLFQPGGGLGKGVNTDEVDDDLVLYEVYIKRRVIQ